MGFVGNYAPCGLAPQIDGMPVILKKIEGLSFDLLGERETGIEPATFSLARRHSTTLPLAHNAQNRNRTSDTRIFSPLLYRLSYLGKKAGDGTRTHVFSLDG